SGSFRLCLDGDFHEGGDVVAEAERRGAVIVVPPVAAATLAAGIVATIPALALVVARLTRALGPSLGPSLGIGCLDGFPARRLLFRFLRGRDSDGLLGLSLGFRCAPAAARLAVVGSAAALAALATTT